MIQFLLIIPVLGALKNYVKYFNAPKLSPFKSNENLSCKYGIISFLDNNEFMTVNETSELFSYLISHFLFFLETFLLTSQSYEYH